MIIAAVFAVMTTGAENMKRADTGAVYFQSIQWGQDVLDMVGFEPPPKNFGELIDDAEKGAKISPSQIAEAETGIPVSTTDGGGSGGRRLASGEYEAWSEAVRPFGTTVVFVPGEGASEYPSLELPFNEFGRPKAPPEAEVRTPSTRPPSKRR